MSGTVWPQVVLSNATGVPYDAGTPLPVTGTISASTTATATAAAPTYSEGVASALSQNLTGDLRVIAKQSGSYAVTIASMPSTPVTGTFWQATQPISAASLPLPTGAALDSSLTTLHNDLIAATPAGSNLIGRAAVDATAATGGITTTTRLISAAATTNATSAKGSAGRLYSIQGYNAAASVRYLKLYNKASAPTVGSDTPIKTIAIPPGAGFALDWPVGYSFSTGIAFALTTGSADADTGALTLNDVLGLNLDYV